MRLRNFLLSSIMISVITGCGTEVTNVALTDNNIQNANIQSSKLKGEDKEKSTFITESLGQRRHDDFQATRRLPYDPKNPNSAYMKDPSYKTTKDASWIRAHDGATKVDIANTNYAQLPGDLKAEYDVPDKVAVDLMLDAIKTKKTMDKTFIENGSKKVYAAVAKKNNSDVTYSKLSEKDKEKYRSIVEYAIQLGKEFDLIN